MLKSLFIKDYALIENIEVEFDKGLNIITGETGAGKSILIDAMGLLLGERASTEIVRKGAEKSIVEGIFDVSGNKKIKAFIENHEIDDADKLIVRREISLKGTNRCFLNDSPVTLNIIKEIGDLLVDLHGQHEHQSLLRVESHIEMLDEFWDSEELIQNFKGNITALHKLTSELKTLRKKESELKEKKELYDFQLKEIDSVSPVLDEESKLEDELLILDNAEKLIGTAAEVYEALYDSEESLTDKLGIISNKINDLKKIDKSFEEKSEEVQSALALLNDVSSFLRSYKDSVELDPERLEEVRIRLGALNMLKKKYGGSIASIIEHRKKIAAEFDLAENFNLKISELEKQINELRKSAGLAAKQISARRETAAKKIKREVEEALKSLGIAESNFVVKIENAISTSDDSIFIGSKSYSYNERGYDFVEFYVSTNSGEEPKPLVKVASGGEISRIMLALKSILAKSGHLPILIFDEIDTGVSGRIAQKVGQTLKQLSKSHQIITITHLPQIAGYGDIHFAVQKSKVSDRVVSSLQKLNKQERIHEVAKLLSGEKITEAALISARELMDLAG
ncbi:MAG: DNA repair protein RecN [Ignavibacteria bacterium]|nr:DNA repair protein RecN [Ignavibacteria bacterium]